MVRERRSKSDIAVSSPENFQHAVHIDHNFGWHVNDPSLSIKLGAKLGESSVGIVYKAMLLGEQCPIAVQIVECDDDQEELEYIKHEISIWQKLRHPCVINYFGSYTCGDNDIWVLMDCCTFGTVQEIMELCGRTLNEKEIACIFASIVRALDYLHNQYRPIVHKDIKSASIQLNEKGEVKLGNFGLSQQHGRGAPCFLEGTPHFMAPEVSTMSKYDHKADIWSLGITAIEMAEGSPPYWDVKAIRAMTMIKKKEPPTFRHPKRWSREFVDFVKSCLVKDANRRASAEDLLSHPFITNAKSNGLKKLCQQVIKAKKKKRGSFGGTLKGTLKGFGGTFKGTWRSFSLERF